MKSSILLAAAALSAASAVEARVGPAPRLHEPATMPARRSAAPSVPGDCTITIAFGSYAMGIDRPTLARMERTLQADRRVRRFTRHPWGREGEVTLCVVTRSYGVAGQLSRQLRGMIPARLRGPVEVVLVSRPTRSY